MKISKTKFLKYHFKKILNLKFHFLKKNDDSYI